MMSILMFMLAACSASPGESAAMPQPADSPKIAPARDGNIAIQEELDAARRARTTRAYDLFIARHPNHPLAEVARVERARLTN